MFDISRVDCNIIPQCTGTDYVPLKSKDLQKTTPLLQEEESDHALHCLPWDGSGLVLVLGNFQFRGVPLIWIMILFLH